MSKDICELRERPHEEARALVFDDVVSGKDLYKSIDAFELAETLGIDDLDCPGGGAGRMRYDCIEKLGFKDVLCMLDSDFGLHQALKSVKDKISGDRIAAILAAYVEYCENEAALFANFLSVEEQCSVLEAISWDQFQDIEFGYMLVPVHCGGKKYLRFEAFIEDDGSCHDLKTPYELRDGKGRAFINDVFNSWEC